MESPSNLRSLMQTLALKKAQDMNAVDGLTNAELMKLAQDLQRQSSVALTTTALSITQSAASEMQHAAQQIALMQSDVSILLTQMQFQISPEIRKVQKDLSEKLDKTATDMSAKLAQMQAQLDQQLQPLDELQMQARMTTLQSQINRQTKPLADSLKALMEDSQALSAMTAKSWLKPVLISVVILFSISLPVWGLTQYLASEVQKNLQLIKQQQQTLQQLQTWGVTMQQDAGGRFLVLPIGSTAETGFELGKRSAIKLLEK